MARFVGNRPIDQQLDGRSGRMPYSGAPRREANLADSANLHRGDGDRTRRQVVAGGRCKCGCLAGNALRSATRRDVASVFAVPPSSIFFFFSIV